MTHNKALVISKWWAGVFAAIVSASVLGAFGFAWNANSQQAVVQERQNTQQQQLEKMATLPERVARVEETVKSTDKTVDIIRQEQQTIGQKLDFLVQNQVGGATRPAR